MISTLKPAPVNGLKAEGVEVALKAVDAATRAFDGLGYSNLVDLGDRLRDLNGLRIADGTTNVRRMLVVRQLYGEDFLEDGGKRHGSRSLTNSLSRQRWLEAKMTAIPW